MPNPLTTTDAPHLLDKRIRNVYIKDGRRKMMSSDGYMFMSSDATRKIFGKYRGGKYSLKQEME